MRLRPHDSTRNYVAVARQRSALALELCRHARQRMELADRRLLQARARLDDARLRLERGRATLPFAGDDDREDDDARTVIEMPRRASTVSDPNTADAAVLDLLEHRARIDAARVSAERAHAESLLGQILWNVGEEQARPLVEIALALLAASVETTTRAEIEALRRWLELHPD